MDTDQESVQRNPQHRHVSTRESLRAAAVDLIASARHEVLICAPMLDAAFFNRADLTQSLGQFIARRPGNRIRILVEDAEHMLQTDVRLVELTRRFSDLILIRRLGEQHHGLAELFIVIDKASSLHQNDINTVNATCDFHAPSLADPLARRFEIFWNASEPITGLHPFRL
mgnify:CR=1 FL=1